ncbi:post-GPI attachment to proteins factor 2-like [Anopheles moucheti]|uniref:post-GPI attachment to proteins factor 2-like n=1 Tax=Anopheles moucheti TaxID=186751 RepID=UPI0022F0EBC8|nr:post-GPI attachment to proteins factor 2-like [Anopheles moucheti]
MDATVDGRVPPDEPTPVRANAGTFGNSQPAQQQHSQNCPHMPQQDLHQHHQPHQQQQQWNLMDNAHASLPGAIQRKSRTNDRSKDRSGHRESPTEPLELDTGHYGDDGGGPKGGKSPSDKLVVHLIIGFRDICVFTLVLPLGTLFVCFVSAYVFQPEEIHETHCRVYNIIPSISAITGVSPQRYLWRVSIALHIGPRFIIAFVYRNWYRAMVAGLNDPARMSKACRMINIVYWLNLVEISALCGVTYISNKENYPLHEKVFIIFMTTSLSYMLATLKLLKLLQPDGPQTPNEESSLRYKQAFFALSIASTVGLILFFLKHRFLCQDLAFSWFALCEYIVASANMGFHCTTMLDFPTEHFLIAKNAKQYKKQQTSLGWKID